MTADFLTLSHLTKSYPRVIANDHVSLSIKPGQIHALLGENGAGKSTLVKIIYGLVQPDEGEMQLAGQPYQPQSPAQARAQGVGMVFQHFSLFESLTVAENVVLGMENSPPLSLLQSRITEVSQAYGLPLDPRRIVRDLSAGERQRVEIIRCLLQDPKLLIMDEPTSVLTPSEVEILFKTLRKLSAQGTAILYISHKLEEIRQLCDEATILRRGRWVAHLDPKEKTANELAELMVGATLSAPQRHKRTQGPVTLAVKGLSQPPLTPFSPALKNISFTLQQGEILGVAGVAGNGQDELQLALSGEALSAAGTLYLGEKDISQMGPNARRSLGLASAPEERLGHAAAPDMTLVENALLSASARLALAKYGLINWSKTRNFAGEIIAQFDVRTPSTEVVARALSGGNLQKFVVGREIMQKPKLLIINQPTWGVDAAAASAIRQALLDLAAQGAAVVVISQDLDELIEISDQFAALYEGGLSEPCPIKDLSFEEIGLLMGGVQSRENTHATA